jgi:hypothetical protein
MLLGPDSQETEVKESLELKARLGNITKSQIKN